MEIWKFPSCGCCCQQNLVCLLVCLNQTCFIGSLWPSCIEGCQDSKLPFKDE
ncbi:hypothetical protein M758_1G083800 [Ceratodon purpureus]|nr:hypothetical protein M758_1G083800 [Ceratodon purpureus]